MVFVLSSFIRARNDPTCSTVNKNCLVIWTITTTTSIWRIITKIRILTVFGVLCVGDSCQSRDQQKKPHVCSTGLELYTAINDGEGQAPALLPAAIKRKRSAEANNNELRTAQFTKQPIIHFTHCYWVNCERTGLLHYIKRRVVESPRRPSVIFFRFPSLVFYSVTCELGPLFACMFVCFLCFIPAPGAL